MKLLFDQNISFRVVKNIEELFPGSEQIKNLNLINASDIKIWEYAKSNDFCIVKFNSDFIDISLLKGFPPKIIWLRIGNTSTHHLFEKISANQNIIKEFLSSSDVSVLELV